MRPYSNNFNGSGTDAWTAPGGSFLLIEAAAGPLSIVAYGAQGGILGEFLAANQGDWWEPRDVAGNVVQFSRLVVNSASAQSVTLIVGYGSYRKGELLGAVSVTGGSIDIAGGSLSVAGGSIVNDPLRSTATVPAGKDAWTASGQTFLGGAYQVAVTGDFSYVGILNPTGSTVKLYVDSIWLQSNSVNVYFNHQPQTVVAGFGQSSPLRMLADGTSAAAQGRMLNGPNATNLMAGNSLMYIVGVGLPFLSPAGPPIIIAPGESILFMSAVPGSSEISILAEWREF